MKINRGILTLIFIAGMGSILDAQQVLPEKNIKSIVVTQEKYEMLVTRKLKESEQYFDIRGNLIEDITYKQGKIKKHFKYTYDSDNKKVREEEYDPSGRLIEFSEYKYVGALRTEKSVYDPGKKLKSKKIYQYTTF